MGYFRIKLLNTWEDKGYHRIMIHLYSSQWNRITSQNTVLRIPWQHRRTLCTKQLGVSNHILFVIQYKVLAIVDHKYNEIWKYFFWSQPSYFFFVLRSTYTSFQPSVHKSKECAVFECTPCKLRSGSGWSIRIVCGQDNSSELSFCSVQNSCKIRTSVRHAASSLVHWQNYIEIWPVNLVRFPVNFFILLLLFLLSVTGIISREVLPFLAGIQEPVFPGKVNQLFPKIPIGQHHASTFLSILDYSQEVLTRIDHHVRNGERTTAVYPTGAMDENFPALSPRAIYERLRRGHVLDDVIKLVVIGVKLPVTNHTSPFWVRIPGAFPERGAVQHVSNPDIVHQFKVPRLVIPAEVQVLSQLGHSWLHYTRVLPQYLLNATLIHWPLGHC